jgi:hypothetical protein
LESHWRRYQQLIAMQAIFKTLSNTKLTLDVPSKQSDNPPKAGDSPRRCCERGNAAWKYENADGAKSIIKAGQIFNWCIGNVGAHYPAMWTVHAANTCTAEKSAVNKVKHAKETNVKSTEQSLGEKLQLQSNRKIHAALLAMKQSMASGADSMDDESEKHESG